MPNQPCVSSRSLSEWPLMVVGTVAVALGLMMLGPRASHAQPDPEPPCIVIVMAECTNDVFACYLPLCGDNIVPNTTRRCVAVVQGGGRRACLIDHSETEKVCSWTDHCRYDPERDICFIENRTVYSLTPFYIIGGDPCEVTVLPTGIDGVNLALYTPAR